MTFTDFGIEGPYMGQMRAAIYGEAPGIQVVDLMVDAPSFDPRSAAYLLPAVMQPLPEETVCLAVIDPGVGSRRVPIILRADNRWYVGPDNGIFEIIARRSESIPEWWEITYAPDKLTASFHGRDQFAPVAAKISKAGNGALACIAREYTPDRSPYTKWPDDIAEVIYIDGYGNCMLGTRWSMLTTGFSIELPSGMIGRARTFSDVSEGKAFCYENAMGLVEIAVNRGHAAAKLGLEVGSQVAVRKLSGK